jgi:hypothetical protein
MAAVGRLEAGDTGEDVRITAIGDWAGGAEGRTSVGFGALGARDGAIGAGGFAAAASFGVAAAGATGVAFAGGGVAELGFAAAGEIGAAIGAGCGPGAGACAAAFGADDSDANVSSEGDCGSRTSKGLPIAAQKSLRFCPLV